MNVVSYLAPMLLRGSVYLTLSLHSHAGAWERVENSPPLEGCPKGGVVA